jgi:hypothetical protein
VVAVFEGQGILDMLPRHLPIEHVQQVGDFFRDLPGDLIGCHRASRQKVAWQPDHKRSSVVVRLECRRQ